MDVLVNDRLGTNISDTWQGLDADVATGLGRWGLLEEVCFEQGDVGVLVFDPDELLVVVHVQGRGLLLADGCAAAFCKRRQ